jgi:acyl dehydratase
MKDDLVDPNGRPPLTGQDLAARIGEVLGVTGWTVLDQARIDAFAEVTEDWQFIHVDPEKAAQTPFGGTIAHGFLTLSLLSKMAYEVAPVLDNVVAAVNYGFDKVRFLQPVRAGQSIRGCFTLAEVTEKDPGRWLIRYAVTVEIDGEARPALVADWLGLQITSA